MANIWGTETDDILYGTTVADVISAGKGHDIIKGSKGADKIDGGEGNDTVDYAASEEAVKIDLRFADQFGDGDAAGDSLTSIENVIGSKFNDYMQATQGTLLMEGGAGADELHGLLGSGTASYAGSSASVQIDLRYVTQSGGDAAGDRLYAINHVLGSAKDDVITGNNSTNRLNGGDGNDTLDGGNALDYLDGGSGNDTLIGGSGNDYLTGGDGIDTVLLETINSAGVYVTLNDGGAAGTGQAQYVNGEHDTLSTVENVIGTAFDDWIWGDNLGNDLRGENGRDDLHGNGGKDVLWGGAGDDTLTGDADADKLYGGSDNDLLSGGAGGDRLDGGLGYDTASYVISAGAVKVVLTGGGTTSGGSGSGGDAEGDTFAGVEHVFGSIYDDKLTGNEDSNTLNGYLGNDILVGGKGRDTLIGGEGNDTLTGGVDDILTRDTFVFELFNEGSQAKIGYDVITDWQSVDKLEFLHAAPNMDVIAEQVGNDTVLTIANVQGSITILNTHASQFDFL